MHQKIVVLLAFFCFGAVNFSTGQTDKEKEKEKKKEEKLTELIRKAASNDPSKEEPPKPKHNYWRNIRIMEGLIDVKYSNPNFNFPPDVYFSPMGRWTGQVADIVSPIPRGWLGTVGLGVNIHPFPLKLLNGIVVGYTFNKQLFENNFRGGSFLSRAQYANGENAFTYARLSGFGPTSTFRFSYNAIPLWKPKGKEKQFAQYASIYLELGPKYSVYHNIEVTQGYDTFDRDVIYRRTTGRGHTLGGCALVRFAVNMEDSRMSFGFRFGAEYEKGNFTFQNFPGKYPFSMLSLNFFGAEIGF